MRLAAHHRICTITITVAVAIDVHLRGLHQGGMSMSVGLDLLFNDGDRAALADGLGALLGVHDGQLRAELGPQMPEDRQRGEAGALLDDRVVGLVIQQPVQHRLGVSRVAPLLGFVLAIWLEAAVVLLLHHQEAVS